MSVPDLPDRAAAVVVGAGLAGAASAYALMRRGVTDLVVLEAEAVAGVHASGRNAAMAYSFIAHPVIRALARRGRDFLEHVPADFPLPLYNRFTGSVTIGHGAGAAALAALAEEMIAAGIPLSALSPDQVTARLPIYGPRPDEVAYFCADDGVIDVDALLQGYLRGARRAGGVVRFGCRALELVVQAGRVAGVQTDAGLVRTSQVILAGGPWANDLAVGAGLAPLPLTPYRRHLGVVFQTRVPPDPAWPLCWHQTEGFYFRPESGGLLVCACDQEPQEPHNVGTDQAQVVRLAERVLALLPGAQGARLGRVWAGLRTLTPDDRFVVGPDPRLPGLYWAAGLGGHGMTTSAAVGEVLADLVVDGRTSLVDAAALSPSRFLVSGR